MYEALPETAQEIDQDCDRIEQLDEIDGGGVDFVGVAQQHHDALSGSRKEDSPEQSTQPHQPQQPHDLDLACQSALVLAGKSQNDQQHLYEEFCSSSNEYLVRSAQCRITHRYT